MFAKRIFNKLKTFHSKIACYPNTQKCHFSKFAYLANTKTNTVKLFFIAYLANVRF